MYYLTSSFTAIKRRIVFVNDNNKLQFHIQNRKDRHVATTNDAIAEGESSQGTTSAVKTPPKNLAERRKGTAGPVPKNAHPKQSKDRRSRKDRRTLKTDTVSEERNKQY